MDFVEPVLDFVEPALDFVELVLDFVEPVLDFEEMMQKYQGYSTQGSAFPFFATESPSYRPFSAQIVFTSGHMETQIFQGPAKNPCPALYCRVEWGIFFFSPHPAPHLGPHTSRAPFSLLHTNFLFWCLIFCGAPSGALLIVVNFVPEMRISSVC